MKAPDHSLAYLLADVSRLMRRSFRGRLEGTLTPAQARALVHVSRNEGIRQIDLADMMEVKPITLARLLDQLAKVGVIERRPCQTDRRAFRIHLTAKAAPHLGEIQRVAAETLAEAIRGVGKAQTKVVEAALQQMRHNLATR